MNNKRDNFFTQLRQLIFAYLIVSLSLFNFLALTVSRTAAQEERKIVMVTADQPNIWTLEQAHYLLAQMHRRNLDLKAKGLNPLDANEINGINIDVLRDLLEVGAAYNEADRFNNNLIERDKTFNTERRRQLIKELDGLQEETVNLTRAIARLKREKETAESADEKTRIEAEIVEKTEVKAAVDKQIELKNAELAKLSSASGNLTATSSGAAFDAKKFPSGGFDETFRKKAAEIIEGFKSNPQLNASLQLDNFLQLQYEIISKQLTLLRDEVGPGERLIFLELPQSINAAYDKSDDMWAQSRWRISGFTRCQLTVNNQQIACHKILDPAGTVKNQNRPPRTTLDVFESVTGNQPSVFEKMNLTFFDVQNRQKLASRFVSPDAEENRNLKTFLNQFEVGVFASTSDAEKQAKQDYAEVLRAFKTLEDAYKAITEEHSKKCNESKAFCDDPNELKKVEEARKDYENKKGKVENPSPVLLDYILKILNAAIQKMPVLNKIDGYDRESVSRRTLILSQIKEPIDDSARKLLNRLWIEDLFPEEIRPLGEDDFPSQFVDLSVTPKVGTKTINGTSFDLNADNRSVRTVEMIPRQSSFNVNDVKIRNRAGAFNFVASFLFGFGANVSYQRQRERYSQFVQQELYSSAFGKGSREFGWTFTSMPGTDKLLSGQRTTYAIAIVPQEATSIVLEATGCSFDRTARQPSKFDEAVSADWQKGGKNVCSPAKNFVVTIPGGGYDANNDFFVSGLTYSPVEKGKRIVVSIYGNNFSSQIGVMINGVSLPASIGLAQRFILDDSKVGEKVYETISKETVRGGFERVDSNQIVASFELVDGKDGTPIITLVSPGKAVDLNNIPNLYINGERNKKLKDVNWMFGEKPKSDFKIKDVQIFNDGPDAQNKIQLTALITKSSFGAITNVFVNGQDTNKLTFGANNVVQVKFPAPNDDKIHIVLVSGQETYKLDPIANPAKPQKPNELRFTVIDTRAIYADTKQEKIAYLLAEIQGAGLTPDLISSVGQIDVVDGNRAFITIPDPKPAQTVRLTNPKNNSYAEGVFVIPRPIAPVAKPSATPSPAPNP